MASRLPGMPNGTGEPHSNLRSALHCVLLFRDSPLVKVILEEWLGAQYKEEFMALLEDEEFTFEAEIFTRRIKAAEKAAEARSEGKSLLSVLGARGFAVTAALRKEILDCGDSARLEGALLRAATGDPGEPFTF
jgi:hypothetical protein